MQTGWQWCSFKCFLGADASPHFLVHNLVWAHPGGLTTHLRCYKHFVQYSRSSVLPRLVGKLATTTTPPPIHLPDALARARGRKSHQYFRLLSPSDVLFIVKSGTVPTTPALHLTLRDGVRCVVSSSEPWRLWRWPWLYPHIIPYAASNRGSARYKERVKVAAAAALSCANSERPLLLPFCSLEIYFSDAGDASCSIDPCVLQVCRYTTPSLRRSCTSISIWGTTVIFFNAEVWSLIAPGNENK